MLLMGLRKYDKDAIEAAINAYNDNKISFSTQ
jgi:hypothetical protein